MGTSSAQPAYLNRSNNHVDDSPRARLRNTSAGREIFSQPVQLDQSSLPRNPPYVAFVGNLSFETTKEDLINALSGTASIVNVSLPIDRETGRPRGIGYIEFKTVEDLTRVLMLSNKVPCLKNHNFSNLSFVSRSCTEE